jgi:hypothetical protein
VPLNSIQNHLLSILDGLEIPGMSERLEAYIQPPTVEDIDGPRAYIWGGRMRGTRQTMPRVGTPAALDMGHAGFKKLTWASDVWISYMDTPDDATVDQNFALILDAIMTAFWVTEMPITISDPTTGVVSQLLEIGEEFDLEYPPSRTPNTLRMLYYSARLTLTLYEAVQA